MGLRLSRCAQCNGLLAEGEHRGNECDVCLKQLVLDGSITRFCPKDEFEVCTHCFKCFYFESEVAFHPHSKWKEIPVRSVDERTLSMGGSSAFYCSYCQSRITEPLAVKCLQCKFLLHANCFEMLKKTTAPGERWPKDVEKEKHLLFRRPIRPYDNSAFKAMSCLADEAHQRIFLADYLSSRILILHSKTLQPVEQWENATAHRTRFFLSVICMLRVSDRLLLFDRWQDFPLQVFSLDGRFMFAGGEQLATHSASCSNIVTDGTLCYVYSMRSKRIEAFDSNLHIRREFIPSAMKDELHKLDKERYDSDKLPMLFTGHLNGYSEAVLGCWIEKKRMLLVFNLKSEALVAASKVYWTEGECALSALFVVNGILYGVVGSSIVAMHLNAESKVEEIGRVSMEECEDGMRVLPMAASSELICFVNSTANAKRLPISTDYPLPAIARPEHLRRLSSLSLPSEEVRLALLGQVSISAASTVNTLTTTFSRTLSEQSAFSSLSASPTQSMMSSQAKSVPADLDATFAMLHNGANGQKHT